MTASDAPWFERLAADRLLFEVSLWSADLGRLADEIGRIDPYADIYHVDVADGHFAPALLFFPDLVAAARRHTARPLHVHLMVHDNILHDQIRQFADAGADLISFHAENSDAHAAFDVIDGLKKKAGMVLKIDTPVSAAADYLPRLSFLTLLGTAIGVKGQDLNPRACDRHREARALIQRHALSRRIILAADGGIREQTVPRLRKAGADSIVAGSLAFKTQDLDGRTKWLRSLTIAF